MSEIQKLKSQVVYKNKWMAVREDTILRPDGNQGIYGVIDKPDFVVILPIQEDQIYLVEQYRYPVGARFWELPQGSWEETPNADPLKVARGELKEETGLIAADIAYVGFQYLAYGYSNQGYHVYLATNLQQSEQRLDLEEADLICKAFSIKEFENMLIAGTIKDATTLNAYSLAKLKGFL